MVKASSGRMQLRVENIFKIVDSAEKTGCAEVSEWTLRVVNVLRELLDNLNMCHHTDTSQLLITTITVHAHFTNQCSLRISSLTQASFIRGYANYNFMIAFDF